MKQTKPFKVKLDASDYTNLQALKAMNGCDYGIHFDTSGKARIEQVNPSRQYEYLISTEDPPLGFCAVQGDEQRIWWYDARPKFRLYRLRTVYRDGYTHDIRVFDGGSKSCAPGTSARWVREEMQEFARNGWTVTPLSSSDCAEHARSFEAWSEKQREAAKQYLAEHGKFLT